MKTSRLRLDGMSIASFCQSRAAMQNTFTASLGLELLVRCSTDLSDEEHMLAAELLLQLTHQPDLDLLEGLELGDGHQHDDRLLAATDVQLLK